jgi:hypothetical protein
MGDLDVNEDDRPMTNEEAVAEIERVFGGGSHEYRCPNCGHEWDDDDGEAA